MAAATRAYCFTIYNWTPQDLCHLNHDVRCRYLCYTKTEGKHGARHIEGYVHFGKRTPYQEAKTAMGTRARVYDAYWSARQNRSHCKQQRGIFVERGEIPMPGRHVLHDAAWEMIQDGHTDQEIIDEVGAEYITIGKRMRQQLVIRRTQAMKQIRQLMRVSLKLWQENVLGRLFDQNDRQIMFVVDAMGGKGKTFLADYIMNRYDAIKFETTVRADCAHAYTEQDFVIFDIARHDVPRLNYGTLEMFKGSYMFSSKYGGVTKALHDVKVIVFMNNHPDEGKLTADRYDIIDLADE